MDTVSLGQAFQIIVDCKNVFNASTHEADSPGRRFGSRCSSLFIVLPWKRIKKKSKINIVTRVV